MALLQERVGQVDDAEQCDEEQCGAEEVGVEGEADDAEQRGQDAEVEREHGERCESVDSVGVLSGWPSARVIVD